MSRPFQMIFHVAWRGRLTAQAGWTAPPVALWDTRGVRERDSSRAGYEVSLQTVAACPTAVVAQATTWAEFPRIWMRLLDEVYAFLRGGGAAQDGQNVMLYRDDVPNVEVGVQVAGPFAGAGRVVPSALPAGLVATTVHRGAYEGLGTAHQAVLAWCAAHGLQLQGTRWEIYGDWREHPAELETQVSYLIR
jgi:effector-binding domain-containing protein